MPLHLVKIVIYSSPHIATNVKVSLCQLSSDATSGMFISSLCELSCVTSSCSDNTLISAWGF